MIVTRTPLRIGLDNVTPMRAFYNTINSRARNIKPSCQAALRMAGGVKCFDFAHYSIGQLCWSLLLATTYAFGLCARKVTITASLFLRMGIRRIALFAHHIMHIVALCTQKQVIWIDALGVVAFVQDTQVTGYSTVSEDIGNTVRPAHRTLIVKLSVPFGAERCCPLPTLIRSGSVDFTPEAICGGILRHVGSPPKTIDRATAVSAARGFLMPNYTTLGGG
jgi:hypothetical protein